jgi:hypothetical protein
MIPAATRPAVGLATPAEDAMLDRLHFVGRERALQFRPAHRRALAAR